MLSRMGCVLVDSGLINDHGSDVLHSYNTNENVKNNSNDESPQRQRQRQQSVGDRYPNGSRVRGATNEMEHGSVVGALNPLVNTVLSLILLLHPSGMAGALRYTYHRVVDSKTYLYAVSLVFFKILFKLLGRSQLRRWRVKLWNRRFEGDNRI